MDTRLNVGFADFSSEFLDQLNALNLQHPNTAVRELFGSIAGWGRTARADDRLPTLTAYQLNALVARMAAYGMRWKWTLNFSSFGGTQDLQVHVGLFLVIDEGQALPVLRNKLLGQPLDNTG